VPGIAEGAEVILGVRPEHLTLSTDETGFAATVVVTEPTGSEVQVIAKHGTDDVIAVFRERLQPRAGETLRFVPDLSQAHLFDAASGTVLRA